MIANPTFVLGPDDPAGTSNRLVRRFLQRQIPTYVEGALNIVDVRDVAAGHLLVDEKGKVGERYILGGRNFTLDRLFADLARISGVRPPPLRLPGQIALTGVEIASRLGIPIPTTGDEVRSGLEWWTYTSAKAERELSYSARPHEETLEDTVRWQMDALGDRADRGGSTTCRSTWRVGPCGSRVGCWAGEHPGRSDTGATGGALPVPHADQRPVPVRRRGTAPSQAGDRVRDAARALPARRSPEIVELTRQSRVPVLVDGDEVIHDSKRILEYLEHAHGRGERLGR